MAQKKPKHVHKYHRIPNQYHTVWSCAFSDCTHFMPNHLEHLIMGRETICWNCGKIALFDATNIEMANPICLTCQFGDIEVIEPSNLEDILSGKKSIDDLPSNIPYEPKPKVESKDELFERIERTKREIADLIKG